MYKCPEGTRDSERFKWGHVFDVVNHFTVIDQQLRVSMENSLLYYSYNSERFAYIYIYIYIYIYTPVFKNVANSKHVYHIHNYAFSAPVSSVFFVKNKNCK